MKEQFVAVVDTESQLAWLRDSLADLGTVVASDQVDVDRVLQLIDSASAEALFVGFTTFDVALRSRLVVRVLERKPRLAVIAVGDPTDSALVLQAVRAGACDFVSERAAASDLIDAVERALSRAGVGRASHARGRMYAVMHGRPDGASACLATHVAIAMQESAPAGEKVLFVDLGAPVGDSLLYLNLRTNYSFTDAVRSVRRFDESLIHAAFARHTSGLAVLPLPEDPAELDTVQMADALALTGVLTEHFDHVLMNLSGFFDMERLVPILAQAHRLFLGADQCLSSCRSNHRLIDRLRREKVDLTACQLVVDRHQRAIEPTPAEVAELLGLPLACTVPSAGVIMVRAMNAGQTVFDVAPGSAYTRALRALGGDIVRGESCRAEGLRTRWARLWSKT
jgi:pilus assembly protein CpaE